MRLLLLLLYLTICASLFGQDTSDASRLRMMSYMKLADKVDCDSQKRSSLEQRICINLEFQKEDSIMNALITLKLSSLSDSLQDALQQEQANWILERKKISEEDAKGYSGNMLVIMYLQSMVDIMRKRIEVVRERE